MYSTTQLTYLFSPIVKFSEHHLLYTHGLNASLLGIEYKSMQVYREWIQVNARLSGIEYKLMLDY